MPNRSDREQQRKWLEEAYPALGKIAQAIIVDSVTASDDIVSNAVSDVLSQIQKGKTFETKGKFFAYLRLAVRRAATKYFTGYVGDVPKDHGKLNITRELRPDRTHTPVHEEDSNPYHRWETVE